MNAHRKLLLAALLLALLCLLITGSASLTTAPTITLAPTPTATTTPTATSTPSPTPTSTPSPTPQPFQGKAIGHGDTSRREIALTFDDGPAPTYTAAILNILQQYHVPATFFMLGVWVQRYPNLARAVVSDGFAVGDHSWSHPDLTKLNASQITQQLSTTSQMIFQMTGTQPVLFRPPYGAYNRQVLNSAAALQLTTIIWNVDPRDWSRPGTGAIINNVLANTRNGSIILLHDGGGIRTQTVAALPTIIERLRARGFTFVTVPQMLQHLTLTRERSGQIAAAEGFSFTFAKRCQQAESAPASDAAAWERRLVASSLQRCCEALSGAALPYLGRGSKPWV